LINKPNLSVYQLITNAYTDTNTQAFLTNNSYAKISDIPAPFDISTKTTDDLNEGTNNKFIVNNIYNNDLTVNGNLIVSGNTTTLNTNLYNTEQLIIDNSASGIALELIQRNLSHDIINISNSTNKVLIIDNSGNIYHNDNSVLTGSYYPNGSLVNITGNIGDGTNGVKMGLYITKPDRANALGFGYNTISQVGSDSNANLSIKSKNSGLVYIGNNTSTPLSVSSSSVGIGTSSHSAKLHITEATGTLHNPNTGSFIIDHENEGGASCIIFRSKINRGSDYGFIQYQDTNEVNSTGELSKLIIGTRNESTDDLILDPSGNLGIGTYLPADKVHIDGNLLLSGTISTYYSDERLKTKIETLKDVLPKLENINVFKYICNDLAESFGYDKNKVEIGLSAQQIKNYYPELIDLAPFDSIYDKKTKGKISKSGENYLTLNYERLIPVLIQAIKELNNDKKILENRCDNLEKEINNIKNYFN